MTIPFMARMLGRGLLLRALSPRFQTCSPRRRAFASLAHDFNRGLLALLALLALPAEALAGELYVQQGHTGGIRDLALSADGKYALTGSQDGTARLWELASGKELRGFYGHTDQITAV